MRSASSKLNLHGVADQMTSKECDACEQARTEEHAEVAVLAPDPFIPSQIQTGDVVVAGCRLGHSATRIAYLSAERRDGRTILRTLCGEFDCPGLGESVRLPCGAHVRVEGRLIGHLLAL